MIKRIIIIVVILVVAGLIVATYQWYKPHHKVENAKGIVVTATNLSKEYTEDEKKADAKYLNKAVEVAGIIEESDKNQDGGIMLILQTTDPVAGVQCTMRDKGIVVSKGQNVVIKGFCSGAGITGVSLTDCVIEKNQSKNI